MAGEGQWGIPQERLQRKRQKITRQQVVCLQHKMALRIGAAISCPQKESSEASYVSMSTTALKSRLSTGVH